MTDDPLEAEAKDVLFNLRTSLARTPTQREVWDWAEDVCLRFIVDECDEERREKGYSLRGFIAADLAYRLGIMLPEMAKDVGPDEARKARAEARVATKIAERLAEIAAAEGVPVT